MRTYSVGSIYEFIVNYYFTTYDDFGSKKAWLSLSDGESDRKFNVPAYPYQETGMEGKTILCKVTRIMDSGYLYLLQDREEVLKNLYKENETYWFTVGEKLVDANSNRPYYQLIDRVNGIDWHRYYCEENTQISGVVGFVVVSIEKNFISLDLAKRELSAPTNKSESIPNPFGHEDDYHEWKSSLVFSAENMNSNRADIEKQILVIMRCIASFQNSKGGLLYIGVKDNGEVCGIENDFRFLNDEEADTQKYKEDTDGFQSKIQNAVHYHLGKKSLEAIEVKFYVEGASKKVFCIVKVKQTQAPVFLDGRDIYRRFGNGNRVLRNEEITDFILSRNGADVSNSVEITMPMPSDCSEYNPNTDGAPKGEVTPSVQKLDSKQLKKKIDYYFMTFFTDDTFMYSKESHASDVGCITETRFNKINGNLEYSRDLLVKCRQDGYVQFIAAYDLCKLGESDMRIGLSTKDLFSVLVAHKYDFLKVSFEYEGVLREKYLRVLSLFGKDTESHLQANIDNRTIKTYFGQKGLRLIPKDAVLMGVSVVHEELPDDIQFVSPRGGSIGIGSVVGSQEINTADY